MQDVRARVVYADLLNMPDDGRRYEIHGGELVVVPSPLPRHQLAAQAILARLDAYAAESGGIALVAPLDIMLSECDVVQPDVVFFRAERRHLIRPDAVTRSAPDIAVEVLSASTAARDRGRKMRMFARYGVPEYWIVDPGSGRIEVYALRAGTYRQAQVAAGDDAVQSVSLANLTFTAGRIFAIP